MVAPLFVPENVSDAHQHEHTAVIWVILLRVIHSNGELEVFFIEHSRKFQCIFEDWVIRIVLFLVSDTVIDCDLSSCKYSKIPMIPTIDRHHKKLVFVKTLFLQNSLDLSISLLEGISCKIGIEDSVRCKLIPDESFLHHFDVNVYHVIVEPLSKLKSS